MDNQRGNSLIYTLVAVGITGILVAATTSLIDFIMSGQNYQRFHSEVGNFVEEVRSTLSSKQACINTFGGADLNASVDLDKPSILDATNQPQFAVGQAYGGRAFSLTKVNINSYVDKVAPSGLATLRLDVQANSRVIGPSLISRTITLATTKDVSNRLIDCVALSKMSDGIWRYVSTKPQDIFFTGGFVGVGTTEPLYPFHVHTEDPLVSGTDELLVFAQNTKSTQAHWPQIAVSNFDGAGLGGAAEFIAFYARGSITAPAAARIDDYIGGFGAKAWDGTSYNDDNAASIRFHAAQNFAANAHGTEIRFFTVANGAANENEVMRLTQSGRLGIGEGNPSAMLHVNGSALATAWNTPSDKTLKNLDRPLSPDGALKIVTALTPYYFRWKDGRDERLHIGILAQDLKSVAPELVWEADEGKLVVDYPHLTAVLVGAIKSLQERLDRLEQN